MSHSNCFVHFCRESAEGHDKDTMNTCLDTRQHTRFFLKVRKQHSSFQCIQTSWYSRIHVTHQKNLIEFLSSQDPMRIILLLTRSTRHNYKYTESDKSGNKHTRQTRPTWPHVDNINIEHMLVVQVLLLNVLLLCNCGLQRHKQTKCCMGFRLLETSDEVWHWVWTETSHESNDFQWPQAQTHQQRLCEHNIDRKSSLTRVCATQYHTEVCNRHTSPLGTRVRVTISRREHDTHEWSWSTSRGHSFP